MSNIDKQWLQQTIADMEEHRDLFPGDLDDNHENVLAALRIALASLEAEPVAWTDTDELRDVKNGGNGYLFAIAGEANKFSDPRRQIMLYTAPPAPESVPDEVTAEDCPAFVKYDITEVDEAWACGFNALRAAMLQGAEPVTTAYKLRDAVETIRNSGIAIDAEKILAERDAFNAPDCWCRTCRPVTMTDMRFVICPDCGNKRCPHANDHRHECTGSNEPGQEGSAYPTAPQQEA